MLTAVEGAVAVAVAETVVIGIVAGMSGGASWTHLVCSGLVRWRMEL